MDCAHRFQAKRLRADYQAFILVPDREPVLSTGVRDYLEAFSRTSRILA
jgi:hypothetical protein